MLEKIILDDQNHGMANDNLLIMSFLSGNDKAFEKLVDKYKNKVFNIIYRVLGNDKFSEDIAQEVFIKVFRDLRKFKGKSSFSTWLYRIVVNRCIDETKKHKYKYEKNFTDEEKEYIDMVFSDGYDMTKNFESNEIKSVVHKSLAQLDAKYRMIVNLRDIEGFSYQEISEIMNISVEKVKIWLFRARAQLKIILRGEYYEV